MENMSWAPMLFLGARTRVQVSTDGGRSWNYSQSLNLSLGGAPVYGEQALTGKGRRPAGVLRTLGSLHIGPN